MQPLMRIGICVLPVLALSVACARGPDVSKFTCTSSAHCPDGYACTGSPGFPGRCVASDAATPADGRETAAALDAVMPVDSSEIATALDAVTAVDGPEATAALDAVTFVDGPGAANDGADVSIVVPDGNVGGGGTTTVPGTGGAGGGGGIVGATGGAIDGGGQGTGGVGGAAGTGGKIDASTASGTGGSGSGGSQTGGVPGTGGVAPPGTGGSIPPGTGGSIPPGTGGSIPPGTGGFSGVTVQLDKTHQTIQGFRINDTWAAESFSDTVADLLFTTAGNGIGLSILRVGMNSIGTFVTSSASADITAARARGAIIIGTTWSPPASWKTNNNENDGGHLRPEYYEQWSDRITSFAGSNNLYAMSPQTQPDFASCGVAEPCNGSYASTLYTADEMVAFIKVLGPKLQAAGIVLLAPEASQWLRIWTDGSGCCSEPSGKSSSDPLSGQYDYGHHLYGDTTAWGLLGIVGTHQYYTQVAEPWPSNVPQTKPVWMTEMSGLKWWPEQGPTDDIGNGVVVAGWIHDALVNGEASAWLWWWYKAYYTDDNEGLFLKDGTDTKRHWTLGNYSKFVRPGYTRVDVAGNIPTDVLLSAYKGADGTVVVVAINEGTAPATVPMSISGGTAPASLVPWVTSASDDLVSKTAVPVSGGSFTAVLGGMTVTTFVGK